MDDDKLVEIMTDAFERYLLQVSPEDMEAEDMAYSLLWMLKNAGVF